MDAPAWVTVPGGPFLMCSALPSDAAPFADETPQQYLDLPALFAARVSVTNVHYWKFVHDMHHTADV